MAAGGPKYPTPASGVRPERAESQAERERREALHGGREGDKTPVNMPLPLEMMAARTDTRTKDISTSTSDIQLRVGKLESNVGELRTKVEVVDNKLDLLVGEAQESRRERQERERVAAALQAEREARAERAEEREAAAAEAKEARAAEERKAALAFKQQRRVDILKILAPIVGALAVLIAAMAGAFK